MEIFEAVCMFAVAVLFLVAAAEAVGTCIYIYRRR